MRRLFSNQFISNHETVVHCFCCSPTEPTLELAEAAVDSKGNASVLGTQARAQVQAEEQGSDGIFNAAARSLYVNALANARPAEQASGRGFMGLGGRIAQGWLLPGVLSHCAPLALAGPPVLTAPAGPPSASTALTAKLQLGWLPHSFCIGEQARPANGHAAPPPPRSAECPNGGD